MKTKLLFCALFSLLALSACNNKQPYEVVFDYTISCNEVFTIELQSSPSTGMNWEWTNKNKVSCIDTIGLDIVPIENKKGAPAIEKWTFKGLKEGDCTLIFEYIDNTDNKSVVDNKKFMILVK